MTRIHCVTRQNKLETPKDKDEVNKREVHECDGRVRDPDVMVVPPTPISIYSLYLSVYSYNKQH